MPNLATLLRAYESLADGWVRVDQATVDGQKIHLFFSLVRGRRGRVVDRYVVLADGTREVCLRDFNGGGLRVYPSNHPAAKQYVDVKQRSQVSGVGDSPHSIVGALLDAHTRAVDDWIPFDRYLGAADLLVDRLASTRSWRFSAPRFLSRIYARVLKDLGIRVNVLSSPGARSSTRLRVLHFGESYIVAEDFKSQRVASAG